MAVPDLVTEEVEVPEWGGAVLVKGLTGKERDAFEAGAIQQKGRKIKVDMANLRARLVALAVVDEEGKRLFQPGDIEALGRKSAAALDRVFAVAQRLSGIGDNDLEELIEDFPNGQNGTSVSV